MAKRKKKITPPALPTYEHSEYQKAIFDYIEHGQGHLVVEAAAGSGKTYTLVKSLDFIPQDKKVLFVAFNRDIVKDLERKTKEHDNVKVMTLHALGYRMISSNFKDMKVEIEEYKYLSHIRTCIEYYTSIDLHSLKPSVQTRYLDNIKKYVDFGRYYLCQNVEDLGFVEKQYDIDTVADEKEVAIKIMEWGMANVETIDYGDMIWLPNVLNLKPYGLKFDFIMLDECQDVNKAERELVLKCFKMSTRMISVGDPKQTIYTFAGSDANSFNALKSLPNTICLPLSISYRCAQNIVKFAQTLVPTIEWNKNEDRKGNVLDCVDLDAIKDGDMVLCRNNAPLMQVYNMFLKMGKEAYILGKELGVNLKKCLTFTRQTELNVDCRKDGVFVRLYDDLFTSRDKLAWKYGIDQNTAMSTSYIQNKLDMIKALEILAEGIKTTDEMIERIDSIFPKKKQKSGIILSTIHKAKGLEANNVYIICRSLMPSPCAQQQWELDQEKNLMYVAYTRAKNTLGFVDESGFEKFNIMNEYNVKFLKQMEDTVNRILHKEKTKVTKENAGEIVKKAKNIQVVNPKRTKTITAQETKTPTSLVGLAKNKKKKKTIQKLW